jgi:hypothetical protein
MVKDSSLAVLLVLVLSGTVWAQTLPTWQTRGASAPTSPRASETVASASAADRFREIAEEIAHAEAVTGAQADQAIILLTAAKTLDSQAVVEPLLLDLATRYGRGDYSQHVRLWLKGYVSATADRVVVAGAVRYLLNRLESAEARQKLLESLVGEIGNRDPVIDSDLALMLGRIMVEKGDLKAAKFYLIQAYTNNKFNTVAFAGLTQLAPDEIGPAAYLEHLRLGLREGPLDIDAALNVAQYAERLELYEVAAGTYEYCAALFAYLYPNEPLPARIYLPWAIAGYNTERGREICLRIAESVRSSGRFDILLEAIAGRAAAKMGNPQEAQRLLGQAEQRALQLLQAQSGQRQALLAAGATAGGLGPRQLAWFYCFGRPEPEKALEWANESYAMEPNSPAAGALLAYALGMNDRLEWARPLLESFKGNQISDVVLARVQLAQGNKDAAIRTLAAAVGKDPGSLAAEQAREMLRQAGSVYTPPVDPQMVLSALREALGQTIVPRFLRPDKMIDVQFSIRGSELAYGEEIEAVVTVANKGFEPLVVTDSSLFRGRIRVDARVGGNLTADIPNLVCETIRTELMIPPGRSLTRSLRLSTGQLRRMLLDHPQAALTVDFTLYVDPVTAEDGSVHNRLADVKPLVVSMTRPGLDLTASYIRNQLNAVSSRQEAQKMRTAQLFTGLLKEEHIMTHRGTLYPFRYADWLPRALRSALVGDSGLLLGQGSDDWVVKVNAMAGMLSMPIDHELAAAVASNLHDRNWAVRLMATHLLATSCGGGFDKVLEWVARNDTSDLVRSMAAALREGAAGAKDTEEKGI